VSRKSSLRLLVLHSRYLSGPASGENRVVEDEISLLLKGGHEVRSWQPSPKDLGGLNLLKAGVGAVWSHSAVSEVERIVRQFHPEVVHIHNWLPTLSPAVIRVGYREGSAVVMTLHNYRLMCLPSTFLRDGRICVDCLGRTPWPGVVHSCYRNSLLGSAAVAASLSVHRTLQTFDRIALFLPVGEFVRSKYIEAGFCPEQMRVKSNFSWPMTKRKGPGDHFLFLGRLSPEKGVRTIMEAWKNTEGKLLIVGDGPDAVPLRGSAPRNVEFTGALPPGRVADILHGARALLVPSVWYEAQPRVILEAYATGVPVVASRIGGLPDLVAEGESGFLVRPDDPAAWAAAAGRLFDDELSMRLGDGAYGLWQQRYSPERGLANLEDAYREALTRREELESK